MSTRRGWIGLALTAVAVLVAAVLWRGTRSGEGQAEDEVATEVPVRVGAVTRATLHRVVQAFGTVEPAPAAADRPAASARLAAPVAGVVASVACTEGQKVARGAVLVQLDTRLADAQVAKAEGALALAEQNLERQKKMQASEATSQRALQEAEQQLGAARSELDAARAERALLVVTTPVAGTVVNLAARAGDAVDPTAVLAEVVDLERLVVTAGIPLAQAAALKTGQKVELSPGIAASLAFVGVQVDARNDTVPIRIALPAGSGLRPGQLAEARIVCEERTCLAVPEEAVVRTEEGGDAVAVVEGETATVRPVRAGLREAGLVEVEGEGIAEGITVVTEGAYGLPTQTKVKVLGK